MYQYNKKLLGNSQRLRKEMTLEESDIWYRLLKKLPMAVKRQKIFGNYIVDFYIPSKKVVIEIDGVQHLFGEQKSSDEKRDEYFNSLGIKVLRYNNEDVNKRFNVVAENILYYLDLSVEDLK